MTDISPQTVGIPCRSHACSHLAQNRCGLVWPGLLNDTKWIYSIPDCPIARLFGDIVERETATSDKFKAWPGRAAKMLFYADLDRARPPERTIDHVVTALRSDDATREAAIAIASASVRKVLEDTSMKNDSDRSPPVVRAFWATCIFVLALFILGKIFGSADRLPDGAPIVRACSLSRSLTGVEPGAEFSISLSLEDKAFVGVILRPDDGRPERIFPPLGAPPGVDWPLAPHPADPANAVEIPGVGRFRLPHAGRGSVIVVWDRERFVDPTDRIAELAGIDAAALAKRLGDAKVFPYEIKTP